MNPVVQSKTTIALITISSAVNLMAAFGQVPEMTKADVFLNSSPENVSVFATGLKIPRHDNGFDGTVTATAPQPPTPPIEMIFPSPTPAATISKPRLLNTRLADPKVLPDASAVCVIPFALAQRGNGERSMAPQGTCSTPWQSVTDMPVDVYGAACASDGTFVYCAGGFSFNGGLMNVFNRYDPGTNTWSSLAPILNGSAMAAAVYYPPTNKIYVFGGGDGQSVIYNFNQIFDISSNTWTTGTPLPDVRAFMAYGYNPANGKIYLVGGYNTAFVDSGQHDTWEYDPVVDTFTNKSDFPEHAGGYASGIINGHLYVAGGREGNTASLNTVWDYDIAADTWTQKNDMPGSQNNGRGSAVALDSLFVFGGGDPFDGPSIATNVYLPATDEWRTAANMNVARVLMSGAALGTKIFAAGAYGGSLSSTLASVEELTASIPDPTASPCPEDQYSITAGSDTIVPGDNDIGNHCDDCQTPVTLPFCFQLYNQTFTSVNVSSNGRLDFMTLHEPYGYGASCLPAPPYPGFAPYDFTIFGLWQDQQTNFGLSGCANFRGGNCGVFTSVSGSAPNRIFNIEWRTVLYSDNSAMQNFEIRLYESDPLKKFEVIIKTPRGPRPRPTPHPRPTPFTLNATQTSKSSIEGTTLPFQYVSGVQGNSNAGFFTQDFCTFMPPQNVSRTYTSLGCGPTPTPTPSARASPTPTPRPTPTARPSPTPHPLPIPFTFKADSNTDAFRQPQLGETIRPTPTPRGPATPRPTP